MNDARWIGIFSGTTGTGTGADPGCSPLPCNNADGLTVEYELAAGTTAGDGVLEHASSPNYAGQWQLLEAVQVGAGAGTALAAGTQGGTFNYPTGAMGFVRFRVGTAFSGGGSPGIIVRCKRAYRW